MMPTADQSAALKVRFKDFWKANGFDAKLPADLAKLSKKWPDEYGEAYEEYKEYGWE